MNADIQNTLTSMKLFDLDLCNERINACNLSSQLRRHFPMAQGFVWIVIAFLLSNEI